MITHPPIQPPCEVAQGCQPRLAHPWLLLLLCLLALCSGAHAQISTWTNGGFETPGTGAQTAANWTRNTGNGAAIFALTTPPPSPTPWVVPAGSPTPSVSPTPYPKKFSIYDGSHSFQANVTKSGATPAPSPAPNPSPTPAAPPTLAANTTFPTLAHDSFQTSATSTYMVSFAAFSANAAATTGAGVDRPKMSLHIDTTDANGNTTSQYETFYPATGDVHLDAWDEYRFSFNAPTGTSTLWFSFETPAVFDLDDVNVYDQTDPVVDVLTTDLWLHGFDDSIAYGVPVASKNTSWTGGDGDWSRVLPDGRVAWLYCDSFLEKIDQGSNLRNIPPVAGYTMPDLTPPNQSNFQFNRNFFGIQSADLRASATITPFLTRQWPGALSNYVQPASLVPPDATNTNGNHYWPAGSLVEGTNLQLILNEHGATENTQVITLSLLANQPNSLSLGSTPPATYANPQGSATPALVTTVIPFGQGFLDAGDGNFYLYDWDGHSTTANGSTSKDNVASVAQVPIGNLTVKNATTNQPQWLWLNTDGKTFGSLGSEPATLTPVPSLVYQGFNCYECLGPNNYAHVFANPLTAPVVQFATSPAGPWTPAGGQSVIPVFPPEQMCAPLLYSFQLHAGTWQNGVYSMSLCDDIGNVFYYEAMIDGSGNVTNPLLSESNPEGTNDDKAVFKSSGQVFEVSQMNRCEYNPHYMRTYNLLKLSKNMQSSYTDTFSNADEVNAWWSLYGGTWSIAGNQLGVQPDSAGASSYGSYAIFKGFVADPAVNPNFTDGSTTVQADVTCHPLDTGGLAGVILHGRNYDMGEYGFDGYAAVIRPGTGVELLIMNGSGPNPKQPVVITPTKQPTITKAVSYTLKATSTFSGTTQTITVYLNGAQVLSYQDQTYLTGGSGVYTMHTATGSTQYQWADFLVSNP